MWRIDDPPERIPVASGCGKLTVSCPAGHPGPYIFLGNERQTGKSWFRCPGCPLPAQVFGVKLQEKPRFDFADLIPAIPSKDETEGDKHEP